MPISLPPVVDSYDDNGLLLRVMFRDNVPSIIKTAVDMSSVRVRDEADYALVTDGMFGREYRLPCVDAGNTLASALYFAKLGSALPENTRAAVGARLRDALVDFGFTPPEELTKVASTLDMVSADQEASEELALRRMFGLGADSAYEELVDEFAGLSPRGRRRLAMQVKTASVDEGVLPPAAKLYGRQSFGTDLEMSLDARALLAPDADVGALRIKLAAVRAAGDVEAAADMIHAFDVDNGLTAYYGRPLPDQYASVLGVSVGATIEKAAASDLEIDGRIFSQEAVRTFSVTGGERLSATFGEDFSQQFSADPVGVLNSLPTPHKKAIARMMDEPAR